MWEGLASHIVGGAIPGLVVLGSVRKQAEQALRASQEAALLYDPCTSSGIQVPALFEFQSQRPSRMNSNMEM